MVEGINVGNDLTRWLSAMAVASMVLMNPMTQGNPAQEAGLSKDPVTISMTSAGTGCTADWSTVQAASHATCIRVPLARTWWVDEPRSGPRVSVAFVPHGIVWVAPPTPMIPHHVPGRWTVLFTEGRPPGGDLARGSRRVGALPAGASSVQIDDVGDGIALLTAVTPTHAWTVYTVSYVHSAAPVAVASGRAAVPLPVAVIHRSHVIVIEHQAGHVTVLVTRITRATVGAIQRLHGATVVWTGDGLLINGHGVPGLAPRPWEIPSGFKAIVMGTWKALAVPETWTVRTVTSGGDYYEGMAAYGPERAQVWLYASPMRYVPNDLGLVTGPEIPLLALPPGARWQWRSSHLVTFQGATGSRDLILGLVYMMPDQGGSIMVTVTVPAKLRQLATTILSTFRWGHNVVTQDLNVGPSKGHRPPYRLLKQALDITGPRQMFRQPAPLLRTLGPCVHVASSTASHGWNVPGR
jgi:hypothetical protein